ncbi:MAG: hypothetical protein PHI58_00850 [Candidatus Omnitrophica bacterium]|nr:hypothetical protein [Candidatus Omnitrophota bacterium]
MASSFRLNITIPDKVVFDGEASSLVVPAEKGYLGVLAHHAPIIARLKPGKITLQSPDGKTSAFDLKTNGFLEFSENRATLLLDSLDIQS